MCAESVAPRHAVQALRVWVRWAVVGSCCLYPQSSEQVICLVKDGLVSAGDGNHYENRYENHQTVLCRVLQTVISISLPRQPGRQSCFHGVSARDFMGLGPQL